MDNEEKVSVSEPSLTDSYQVISSSLQVIDNSISNEIQIQPNEVQFDETGPKFSNINFNPLSPILHAKPCLVNKSSVEHNNYGNLNYFNHHQHQFGIFDNDYDLNYSDNLAEESLVCVVRHNIPSKSNSEKSKSNQEVIHDGVLRRCSDSRNKIGDFQSHRSSFCSASSESNFSNIRLAQSRSPPIRRASSSGIYSSSPISFQNTSSSCVVAAIFDANNIPLYSANRFIPIVESMNQAKSGPASITPGDVQSCLNDLSLSTSKSAQKQKFLSRPHSVHQCQGELSSLISSSNIVCSNTSNNFRNLTSRSHSQTHSHSNNPSCAISSEECADSCDTNDDLVTESAEFLRGGSAQNEGSSSIVNQTESNVSAQMEESFLSDDDKSTSFSNQSPDSSDSQRNHDNRSSSNGGFPRFTAFNQIHSNNSKRPNCLRRRNSAQNDRHCHANPSYFSVSMEERHTSSLMHNGNSIGNNQVALGRSTVWADANIPFYCQSSSAPNQNQLTNINPNSINNNFSVNSYYNQSQYSQQQQTILNQVTQPLANYQLSQSTNHHASILPSAGNNTHHATGSTNKHRSATNLANFVNSRRRSSQNTPRTVTPISIDQTISGGRRHTTTTTATGVSTSSSPDAIALLVDNQRFYINLTQLRAHPDTMLGKMFSVAQTSDGFGPIANHQGDFELSGQITVGLTAEIFGAVLQYYTLGKMRCPSNVPVQDFKEICDYLLIPFNYKTVQCDNLRAFLHEISNDGAKIIFERFLDEELLSEMIKSANMGERECHIVILLDDDIVEWDHDNPPQIPDHEINSQILYSTQMYRFLKYIENREVAKQVLHERGLKKIRIGIEGYPTHKEKVKMRSGHRKEVIYSFAQRPFLRMSWEEEENRSRHVDFQFVKSKSNNDLTSLGEVAENRLVDLPPSLTPPPVLDGPEDQQSAILESLHPRHHFDDFGQDHRSNFQQMSSERNFITNSSGDSYIPNYNEMLGNESFILAPGSIGNTSNDLPRCWNFVESSFSPATSSSSITLVHLPSARITNELSDNSDHLLDEAATLDAETNTVETDKLNPIVDTDCSSSHDYRPAPIDQNEMQSSNSVENLIE